MVWDDNSHDYEEIAMKFYEGKMEIEKKLNWYVSQPDTIRGQEPRIRNGMPAIRDNDSGREVCILTNYSLYCARLMAAAPDLFLALQDMISDKDDLSNATLEFAKTAIAKAHGEIN